MDFQVLLDIVTREITMGESIDLQSQQPVSNRRLFQLSDTCKVTSSSVKESGSA